MVQSVDLTDYLRRLVDEEGISEVVVGVPRTLGGEVGFQARNVLDTLDALKTEFPGVQFVKWDERLTTRIAASGSRGTRGQRKGAVRVDHLAAARMLQEYLEARANL